ncbi:hypothetical protein AMTR_s00032p00240420 [Amborella trichopoda]|uniref:Uncharacterized protein n=1 Tax=Amborella trichopoda TaxID=13333 RepID=U5CPF6_AMBTC|nr:hypothetical protein AMTR_s00032p00240420 [Amborella trichopoda]
MLKKTGWVHLLRQGELLSGDRGVRRGEGRRDGIRVQWCRVEGVSNHKAKGRGKSIRDTTGRKEGVLQKGPRSGGTTGGKLKKRMKEGLGAGGGVDSKTGGRVQSGAGTSAVGERTPGGEEGRDREEPCIERLKEGGDMGAKGEELEKADLPVSLRSEEKTKWAGSEEEEATGVGREGGWGMEGADARTGERRERGDPGRGSLGWAGRLSDGDGCPKASDRWERKQRMRGPWWAAKRTGVQGWVGERAASTGATWTGVERRVTRLRKWVS